MKRLTLCLFALMWMGVLQMNSQDRQQLTEYKLPNGLTVMLWENHDQEDVTGYVAVREKPVYEEIIRLYDAYSTTTDAVERDTLAKRINRLSMQEMQ